MTATRGRASPTKLAVVDEREPWCETLRTSTGGPRARLAPAAASPPPVESPVNTTRRPPACSSSTMLSRVGVAAQAAGCEDRRFGLAEPRREAAARLHHRGAGAAQRRRQTARDRARDPGPARPVAPDERRQTAGVVGVQVRDDECVEAAHAQLGQRRLHGGLRARRAAVHQPGPGAAAQRRRVALPDVDEDDAQRGRGRRARRGPGRRVFVAFGLFVGVAPPEEPLPVPPPDRAPGSRSRPAALRDGAARAAAPARRHGGEPQSGGQQHHDQHARVCETPVHRVTLPVRADASCPGADAAGATSTGRRVQPPQPPARRRTRVRPQRSHHPRRRRRRRRRASSAGCPRRSSTCTSRARSSPSSCWSSGGATASTCPARPPRSAAPSTASAASSSSSTSTTRA